jgi:hypothetical protein
MQQSIPVFLTGRTSQSMKERFRRYILPKLDTYQDVLSPEDLERLKTPHAPPAKIDDYANGVESCSMFPQLLVQSLNVSRQPTRVTKGKQKTIRNRNIGK